MIFSLEEARVVKSKFEDCKSIFHNALYKEGDSMMCQLHNAFEGDGTHHNCLGCNFADATNMINNYLSTHNELKRIQQDFTIYILLLYLLVERMETILSILQVPDKYTDKHFKVFQQIRKWANFIKHPKSFILTHHPVFDFKDSGLFHSSKINIDQSREYQVLINDQFVEKYYRAANSDDQKRLNKELHSQLKNKKDVCVEFPDISALTKKFCYSVDKFVQLITKNDVYVEILTDESTISNYFENQ